MAKLNIGCKVLGRFTGIMQPVISRTYAVWNSADKDADIVLSNGDLTATTTNIGMVRATVSKTAQTAFWQITVGAGTQYLGMASALTSLGGNTGNDLNSWGYNTATGAIKNNNGTLATVAAASAGDEIGMEYDGANHTLEWFDNAGASLYKATAIDTTMFAAWSSSNGDGTANFGATAFTYASPNAFQNYD